ncbi:MAG: hypothetical protein K2W94_07215 [Alphaproteobacteria bacterium]|nr:hypothetical protein [Alphaproteobacteria bacterium]
MKKKIAFLTVLMALWVGAGFASGFDVESGDPMQLGRNLLARIDTIQAQQVALEAMLGDSGPYKAFAGKSVQKLIDALDESTDEPDVGFLAALNSCVNDVYSKIDPSTTTLAALLEMKGKNLGALSRLLASMGVDISALRPEAELAKVTAAAVVLETMPSKEEVFRGDFNLRPDLGQYLHYYLTYDDLDAFFNAQALLGIKYGAEFIENDQRLPAIFGAGGREYKRDSRYIWRNLMEIVMNRFHGGGDPSDGPFNPYAEKLKYNDVWDINARLAGSTHNKKTLDAYRHFNSSGVQKAGVRLLRGLKIIR